MKRANTWRLRHPSQATIGAVLALTEAEQYAAKATLTSRQASELLAHLRTALAAALSIEEREPAGRCVFCAAGLSSDRAMLNEAAKALRHAKECGACGEDSWNSCASGGQHAERTLDAIETRLGVALSVDAVDPVGELAKRDPSTRDVV